MPANPNIPSYSAADLLRYATGRMTAPEMHALEKAALEDPFLAEALEGYMEAVSTQSERILQNQIDRLSFKKDEKRNDKVVPLWRRTAFRIAIAAMLIAGAGWLVFSLVQQPAQPDNQVAVKQPANVQTADTTSIAANLNALDSSIAYQPKLTDTQFKSETLTATNLQAPAQKPETNGNVDYATAPALAQAEVQNPALGKNAIITTNEEDLKNVNILLDSTAKIRATNQNADKMMATTEVNENSFAKQRMSAMRYNYYGKITDAQGNALPYTNVMIVGQDFGTYTDANGNFNFISEDSTLPIKARSLGYVSQNFTLKPIKQQNKIVLNEDEKLKNNLTLVMPQRQQQTAKVQPTIIERDSIEGAEPRIGFNGYNLYLANNNRISELQQMGRQVKLNFDIDKDGNATNISVAQSSGEALDQEAIRLLKEGPKWKGKKGKKGNITVKF